MPQYHSNKHPYLGKITITPRPWWRNLFKFLPYFVGDQIRFRVQIETPQEKPFVYEKFGNSEIHPVGDIWDAIDSGDKEIIGNPITGEGDVEYKLGFYGYPDSGNTIVTAQVINKDRWALGCIGFIAGIISTVVAGIVLGFIKVEPILRLFIIP